MIISGMSLVVHCESRSPLRNPMIALAFRLLVLLFIFLLSTLSPVQASTSINAIDKRAYGADVGWIDFRGDTNNGAVIGEFVCSGFLYAANVGWIHLGSNAPANGIQYQNKSATDYGVNHDGLGNLRGLAYGANIGWINFESNGAPKVDLRTGRLTGAFYSANCGWISLSNAFAFVQTDTIPGGKDSNANGLPDAWERIYFGGLGVDPNADPDGDGMSNLEEYLAGTTPTNSSDALQITDLTISPEGTNASITWSSVLTRFYTIQESTNLNSSTWTDSIAGIVVPVQSTTTHAFTDSSSTNRFYRIQAFRPLAP